MKKELQSQGKREKHIDYDVTSHIRDVNGHEIFKNNRLTSQFLSNYTGIQMLAGVRPEDIEDVTERYHAFLGIEFESDTIKKVCLHQADGTPDREIYVISLIEHKSAVDYDVAMQLFRYMSVIWYDYRMEQNKKKKDANRRKAFRYPLIIPFVYYEGKEKWTAGLHLKDRIEFAEEMSEYIPDFQYHVVSVQQYTNEELSKKGDEMALVMLINKIQNPEDWKRFTEEAREFVDTAYAQASDEIKEVIIKVLWALLKKMNVPNEEARELMGEIGGQGMGILFENAEKMDIQAERKNTHREKERADAEKERADAEKERADVEKERADAAERQLAELREKLARLESEK